VPWILISASALVLERGEDDARATKESETRFEQMAKCTMSTFFNNSKFTFVLHAPLELDHDGLARQVVQEGLRVDGDGLCGGCA
jgi:hypothetical protein